jgi:hypothetical protein
MKSQVRELLRIERYLGHAVDSERVQVIVWDRIGHENSSIVLKAD